MKLDIIRKNSFEEQIKPSQVFEKSKLKSLLKDALLEKGVMPSKILHSLNGNVLHIDLEAYYTYPYVKELKKKLIKEVARKKEKKNQFEEKNLGKNIPEYLKSEEYQELETQIQKFKAEKKNRFFFDDRNKEKINDIISKAIFVPISEPDTNPEFNKSGMKEEIIEVSSYHYEMNKYRQLTSCSYKPQVEKKLVRIFPNQNKHSQYDAYEYENNKIINKYTRIVVDYSINEKLTKQKRKKILWVRENTPDAILSRKYLNLDKPKILYNDYDQPMRLGASQLKKMKDKKEKRKMSTDLNAWITLYNKKEIDRQMEEFTSKQEKIKLKYEEKKRKNQKKQKKSIIKSNRIKLNIENNEAYQKKLKMFLRFSKKFIKSKEKLLSFNFNFKSKKKKKKKILKRHKFAKKLIEKQKQYLEQKKQENNYNKFDFLTKIANKKEDSIKDIHFRLVPLNPKIKDSKLYSSFRKKLRNFRKNMFKECPHLFCDLVAISSLINRKQIFISSFTKVLGLIFESLPKHFHGNFLGFVREIMELYIKAKTSYIVGMKIQFGGRIKGNNKAKTVKTELGSLNITTIKSQTIHHKEDIHTKYGTYGLKVWITYGSVKLSKKSRIAINKIKQARKKEIAKLKLKKKLAKLKLMKKNEKSGKNK